MSQIDMRGIGIYLGITLGLGWLLQLVFLYTGLLNPLALGIFGYAALFILMALPALAAVVARQLAPIEADAESTLWPLPAISTFRIIAVIPLVMLAANAIMSLLGWTGPDLGVRELVFSVTKMQSQPLPPEVQPILPAVLILGGLGLSVVLGASLYALCLFPMEYGWRGYVLPKLAPLGALPARFIASLGPIVFALPGLVYMYMILPEALDDLPEDLLKYTALSIGTGMFFGALWQRSRHLGLVCVAAGTLTAHASTLWDALFPNDFWIFTGGGGLVLSAFWLALSFVPGLLVGGKPAPKAG